MTAHLQVRAGSGNVLRANQVHAQPADSHLQTFLDGLWTAVRIESGGRLDVTVHPDSMNLPGAGHHVLNRVLTGEVEFHVLMGPAFDHLVPAMSIQGLPFAYASSEDVARAMDGELGNYLRSEMAAKGLCTFRGGLMENGFRQIVSVEKPVRTVDDLAGYRMRVPVGRVFSDVFASLGAVPVVVTIDRLVAAMRGGEVDGQENPLVVAGEHALHEVAKYVSISNHIWSGFNLYGNLEFWNRIPRDVQAIVERNVRRFVAAQRAHVRRVNSDLEAQLAAKGMRFNTVDTAGFRRRLSGPFYARWKQEVGSKAWSLMEATTGTLG